MLPTLKNIVALAAFIGLGAVASGQTVRLAARAVVAGETVAVGDVAKIEAVDRGEAERIAQLVVVGNLHGTVRVRAEDVLCAIVSQDPKLAARLQVAGAAACVVTPEAGAAATQPAAGTGEKSLAANTPVVTAAVVGPEPAAGAVEAAKKTNSEPAPTGATLADLLTTQVASELNAAREDVRVEFETVSSWLDQAAPADCRWQYRPLVRTFIGTVQWEAQLLKGRQLVQRVVVQARVLRRVDQLVAAEILKPRDVVKAQQVRKDQRWVDRQVTTSLTEPREVIGQEALRPVAAGSTLDQRDFRPVELAAKGDSVVVVVVRDNLRIRTKGRAMGPGKLHDRIAVRNDATGETVEGTLIDRQLVVVGATLDAKAEQQVRDER